MQIGDIETDDYTIEELSIIRADWQGRIDHIMAQLKEAKEGYLSEDRKADPNWLYNARRALSINMANIKKLDVIIKGRNIAAQEEIQEAARQRKAQERKEFSNAFIDVAKDILEDDLFFHLIECTVKMVNEMTADELTNNLYSGKT